MSKVTCCGRDEEGNFKLGNVKMANMIVSGAFCTSFDSCLESCGEHLLSCLSAAELHVQIQPVQSKR